MRRKFYQVGEEKRVADLKLAECEKFIGRLGKEYENRNNEIKSMKDNESKLISELTKDRNEKKTLTTQHDKDVVVIRDLQRQVKEMEMILRRKHPDSVSALIGEYSFSNNDNFGSFTFILNHVSLVCSGIKIVNSRRQ